MLKPSINYSVNLLKRNFRMQCMYLYVHASICIHAYASQCAWKSLFEIFLR